MPKKRDDKKEAEYKTIKEAIDTDNVTLLSKCDPAYIRHFSSSGLNALLYACTKANFKIIQGITEIMMGYFESYKNKEDLEDDWSDFFYDNFFDEEGKEYNAITILLMRGSQDGFDSFKYLNNKLKFYSFHTEKSDLIKNVASPYGSSFEGFLNGKIQQRSPRIFSGERERQLLKQFSTILFFEIKEFLDKPKDLVEIQTMHIRIEDKSYLFVVGNKSDVTGKFSDVIEDHSNLKEVLTKKRNIKGDLEGKHRVKRYTENFKQGIFGDVILYEDESEDQQDLERFNQVKSLLKASNNLDILKLTYTEKDTLSKVSSTKIGKILNSNDSGKIIFIDTSSCIQKYISRHAEEFLVDIAEVAASYAGNKDMHVCISGKKRPCITCFGRMENSKNKLEREMKFGRYPGLIWMQALSMQDEPSAEESIKALSLTRCHVTLNEKGKLKTDYDSATDEEDQNEAKFQ